MPRPVRRVQVNIEGKGILKKKSEKDRHDDFFDSSQTSCQSPASPDPQSASASSTGSSFSDLSFQHRPQEAETTFDKLFQGAAAANNRNKNNQARPMAKSKSAGLLGARPNRPFYSSPGFDSSDSSSLASSGATLQTTAEAEEGEGGLFSSPIALKEADLNSNAKTRQGQAKKPSGTTTKKGRGQKSSKKLVAIKERHFSNETMEHFERFSREMDSKGSEAGLKKSATAEAGRLADSRASESADENSSPVFVSTNPATPTYLAVDRAPVPLRRTSEIVNCAGANVSIVSLIESEHNQGDNPTILVS